VNWNLRSCPYSQKSDEPPLQVRNAPHGGSYHGRPPRTTIDKVERCRVGDRSFKNAECPEGCSRCPDRSSNAHREEPWSSDKGPALCADLCPPRLVRTSRAGCFWRNAVAADERAAGCLDRPHCISQRGCRVERRRVGSRRRNSMTTVRHIPLHFRQTVI